MTNVELQNKMPNDDGGSDKNSNETPPESLPDPGLFEEDEEDFKLNKRPIYSRAIALVLGIATLLAVALGVYFFLDKDDIDLKKGEAQHEDFQGTVAMATMELHAVPEDCWMSIHGNVYDLTDYAPIHPGEPTLITRHCGTDATQAYDFEHTRAMLPIVDEFMLGSLETTSVVTMDPTRSPVTSPPTSSPSSTPTTSPTTPLPTTPPTSFPTLAPIAPDTTRSPTLNPTSAPPTLNPTAEPTAPTMNPTAAPTGCPMEFYTLGDVAQHPDDISCWYVLYGVVYDFTDYIDDHKGGRGTILAECGTDATIRYEEEKKHDVDLLVKKGFSSMIIGRLGATRETGEVPCDEVDLVAVTVPLR